MLCVTLKVPTEDPSPATVNDSLASNSSQLLYEYRKFCFELPEPPVQILGRPLENDPLANDLNTLFSKHLLIALTLLGIPGNLLNLLVFYRQGFLSDSCVPVFTSLAISDLAICSFNFANALHWYVSFGSAYSWAAFQLEINSTFAQMTSLATVYLALERMVSVTFPFKARDIFTPRVSLGVMVGVYLVSFIFHLPSNFPKRFGMIKMLSVDVRDVATLVNNIVLRPTCVLLVLVLNLIIIVKVASSLSFRKQTASSSSSSASASSSSSASSSAAAATTTEANTEKTQSPSPPTSSNSGKMNKDVVVVESKTTNVKKDVKRNKTKKIRNQKEMKLIRMMIVVCLTFLCCYFPNTIIGLDDYLRSTQLTKSERGVYYPGSLLQENVKWIQMLTMMGKFLEVFNSSCNIVIYYTMSTKFRTGMKQLLCFFCRGSKK